MAHALILKLTQRRVLTLTGLLVAMSMLLGYPSIRESSGRRNSAAWFTANNEVKATPSNMLTPQHQIPKILHQVFASDMVFVEYKSMIASCLKLNPDWKYYLWRDADAEALIAERYPSFAARYKEFEDAIKKSDAIRYIIMYLFGGIYLDMDVECVRPFFPALANVSAFIDQERTEQTNIIWGLPYSAMNSAMGGPPGHPFYREVIAELRRTNAKDHAVFSTGPAVITKVYNKHYRGPSVTLPPLKLLDHRVMSPVLDVPVNYPRRCKGTEKAHTKPESARSWLERGCISLRRCNWRMDYTDHSTVAIHRFLHLGYHDGSANSTNQFDMMKEFSSRLNHYLDKRGAGTAPHKVAALKKARRDT